MVVKATDDRLRCDAAYVLNGTMDWSVFAKRPMSPQLVVVACNPFRSRMACDVHPDKFSALQLNDDKNIEQFEADGWGNE